MAYIWTGMIVLSVIYGTASGNTAAVGAAAMEGAGAAFSLVFSIGGMICLWSGVLELMRRSGAAAALSKLLRPVLGIIFPNAARDRETLDAISQNVSANMLGLGNAATPAGVRAAKRMAKQAEPGAASDELCRLVVMNTASLCLLPATVAAVRAGAGARSAFDILPAVWLSSAVSVAVGLLCARLFERSAR